MNTGLANFHANYLDEASKSSIANNKTVCELIAVKVDNVHFQPGSPLKENDFLFFNPIFYLLSCRVVFKLHVINICNISFISYFFYAHIYFF